MTLTRQVNDMTNAAKSNVIQWTYGKGATRKHYASHVERVCPECGAFAVVQLPREILADQTDGTTHVCHPGVGGCNQGFAVEVQS